MGTTSYTIHAETTWTDTITLDQNFTLINHTMPFIEANDEEQQFSSSEVEISMTSFSTRSYVSEDFSDEATLSEGTGLLWTNTSDYQEETNFNITDQFSSSNVEIDSNATVQLALSGDFLAEYSFTDDTVGGDPADWDVTEPTSCTVNVVASQGIHSQCVELADASAEDKPRMDQDFSAGSQATGTVEFWAQVSSNSVTSFVISVEDTDDTKRLGSIAFFNDGNIKALDGAAWTAVKAYSAETWYHFRIDWDASDWHLWIDTISEDGGSGFDFYGSPISATRFYIGGTDAGQANCSVDGVDYSWGSGYYTYQSYNNTYEPSGYYESPQYDLGNSNANWYYQDLEFQRTVDDDTTFTLEYRHSQDNSTWESWSAGYTSNQTINANCSQYFQFRVNLTSTGNYTTTSSCEWVNLTYELQNSTAVDEYVGNGIITSWNDYTNSTFGLFIDVSALCEDEDLILSILSDSSNKTITIWNDTSSETFYTDANEFVSFDLYDDYGITFLENLTFTASAGEYWNSIVIHQNYVFDIPNDVGYYRGIVQSSDSSYYQKIVNDSEEDGNNRFTWTASYENNPTGSIEFEALHNLFYNVSFMTLDLYNVTQPPLPIVNTTVPNGVIIGAYFHNATGSYYLYYDYPENATLNFEERTNSSTIVYLIQDNLQPNTEYEIIKNISADFENAFGSPLEEFDPDDISNAWYFSVAGSTIDLSYLGFCEYRTDTDISINGTSGDQTISTSGIDNTLNFSTSVSDVEFTYTTTYSISYSGLREWVWPTFVFTYEQLNKSITFVNMSFTELPPWFASYYPDFLTFYLISKMADPDVQSFLTDPVEGTISATTFEAYIGNTTISEGGVWNFLLIIEMREDPPTGTNPEQETPLAVQVLNKFGLFLGLLIGGVLGMMYIQGRRKAGNSGGTKVVYKTDKAGATTAKREASKWRKLYEQEHSDRVKLEKSKDKMQAHHEQEQKSILGKMQAAIEKEKKDKQHALSKTKDHFLSKISKLEAGKDAVSAKLSATSQELNSLKGNVSKAHHEIVNEVSNGMQSLFGTVENVGENVKDFAAQGVEHMKGEGQKIINNTHEKLKTVFKIKPKKGR